MALNKLALKNQIKTIFNTLKTFDGSNGQTQDDAINKLSSDLASAIDVYVKTATVSTVVTVVPSTGIGTGTGNLS